MTPVEALCLDMQGIWINKAEYVDAEHKFQIAQVQEQNANRNQDNDKFVEALRYEAKKMCHNLSMYANAERLMKQNKQQMVKAQQQKKDGLTPYQGGSRCYGEFKCKSCKRKWPSAFSWANMSQQCKRCNRYVYPYRQHKLSGFEESADHSGGEWTMLKEHDTTKCQKCQQVHGDCRRLGSRYYMKAK